MGEIGKITRTIDFADLPADIRDRFVPGKSVTVVYEGEVASETAVLTPEEVERRKQSILRFAGVGAHMGTTVEEAVARVRALRDEWD